MMLPDLAAPAPMARRDPEPGLGALLARCQAGDQGAWRRLVGLRASQVYRWAVLLGLPPHEAEDASQEVFAVAARRIATCQAERALTAWLFQITRRVCANQRRQARWRRWWRLGGSEPPAAAGSAAFEPSASASVADELAVRSCLARLSPRLAEALVAVEVGGLTREEAAAALGVPAGTVASRLRLGRRAFQALWDGRREEDPR